MTPWPMDSLRRRLLGAAALGAMTGLAGCADVRRPNRPDAMGAESASRQWSGRMALQVDDASTAPVNAGFELTGQARQGELVLLNPLGNVLATLEWSPSGAVLQKGSERRESPSLDTLVTELTGSPLPVAALFEWLQGNPMDVPGWEVDLTGVGNGRLTAHRQTPLPQATLRIALDR
ncbi:lipoprotein insertase outer membrane protein LolB [Acidovorax sp. NCPPB 4044]|uniref:lipoprotein insertase outer membrane protein LolB n=1 Tax=Acidovorax sp. NCPPB 4044 TaxID=2940490 RepID=UPI002302E4EA|nr:lipoprotein insertase outer membrane protein LolB [Acidovorax sp. NCPPB 4044]MDA8522036.1 outer membrane lipoprotein LolB [Acidovorax sp. NCPPB 4044]